MRYTFKIKAKYIYLTLLGVVALLLSTSKGFAQKDTILAMPGNDTALNLVGTKIPAGWVNRISERTPAYILHLGDSTLIYGEYISKDSLDAPIEYSAEDSAIMLIQQKEISLHGKANVKHTDVSIDANTIHYTQETNLVKAWGGTDTSKHALNLPTIVQGDSKSIMDTVTFNLKNQKGIMQNAHYSEGEMFVAAQTVKKVTKDIAYAYNGVFTTCNLDTPHFGIRARHLEMINNKFAVSGPAIPEFEGVPMPIVIPFGIFPLTRGRHSGLLAPAYTSNATRGLGLEGLGYYKVVNDYWDVTTKMDIYTYGSYHISFNPRYYKRYHYTGNFTFDFQKINDLNSGSITPEEFNKSSTFQINWSHSQDSKAHPGETFSANVSAGSTKYNQLVANNPYQNFSNQLNSSITFSKSWNDGKYNLSLAANHNQNSNTRLINVTFPTANFSMNTFYPFQKLNSVKGNKWYEKLGISYSSTFLNQASFYDSAFSFKKLKDTLLWGATHTPSISLTLPAVGPLLFSPSISYSENWYSRKITRTWDDLRQKIDTAYEKGFFSARQMSFGMSMNTRIFGTFNFGKDTATKLPAVRIRHEIRPNISLSYQPDMGSRYYHTLQIDTTGPMIVRNGRLIRSGNTTRVFDYDGNVVGGFGEGTFGGLTFGLDNLLEMKVRNKKDTTGDEDKIFKKVKLIDGLSINSGYNFLADSLKWQPVSFSFRTTLFEKLSLSGNALLDQYDVDTLGRRINRLLWTHGSMGRFTSGGISMSASFQSKKTDKRSDKDRMPDDPTMTPDEQLRQLDYIRNNPADFVDFNIPWNLQTSFSFNFSRTPRANYRGFVTNITSSLNLNGDLSLTPKWKIGGSTSYDVRNQKIGFLTMFVTREMHCWQMAINVTPIGPYKSFSVVLNPKAGILRDLRINRSRTFTNY